MSEDIVLLELHTRWKCDLPFGWVPTTGFAAASEAVEIYDSQSFGEWFGAAIKTIIADTFGIASVYEIEEGGTVRRIDLATGVFGYTGLEYMYTDAAFRFLLYFSHESSVAAGGEALLAAIHRAWPAYAAHFWSPASSH